VIEVTPLNTLFPLHCAFAAPFLVTVTLPLNVLPLKYTSVTFAVIFAPKVVPAKVKDVAVELNVPLLQLPPLQTTTPVVFNVKPFRFNTPVVIVKLVRVVLPVKIQLFAPVTMVALSAAPGIPFGVQLVLVVNEVEVVPFQT
jgi:hypothetical protein